MDLYGIMGDQHLPWGHEKKTELALQVMKDRNITHLIINGDLADFYNLNAHGPKDPAIRTKLDDEFESVIDFLTYIRKFFGPNVVIIYIFGNHEYRLDRFVMANCPAFYNHLKLEKMLQLDSFDIEWIPYNQPYVISDSLRVQHSPPSYSANAARASLMKKVDVDHIFNCTHRRDNATITGASGRDYEVVCNGWFGSLEVIKKNINEMAENRRVYMFTKNHENWNCSFSFATIYKNNHSLESILIKEDPNGRVWCSVGGTHYEL